jgi:hypothetical protein
MTGDQCEDLESPCCCDDGGDRSHHTSHRRSTDLGEDDVVIGFAAGGFGKGARRSRPVVSNAALAAD